VPGWRYSLYRMDMLLCCVDVMTRERAVACVVAGPESPLRVAFHYSSPQTYWHMCRNGENGRRDAHQWKFSIHARLTGRGVVCVRRCATGFSANCAGSRMCGRQPAQNRTAHTCLPRTAGRAIEWHCRATHPPVASTLTSSSTSEPRGDNGQVTAQ
jgi:hypothetical protein